MEPIRNMDQLISRLQTELDRDAPPEAKQEQIHAILAQVAPLFEKYKQATHQTELRELVERIEPLSKGDADALRDNVDGLVFPKETMKEIIGHLADSKDYWKNTAGLRKSSKETRKLALEGASEPLMEMGITTADKAIEFAKQFGKDLTVLNISGINFSSAEKLEKLLTYLPSVQKLRADRCQIKDLGALAITTSENMSHLIELKS